MHDGSFYKFWVYNMGSRTCTLYTGMTAFFTQRVGQHKIWLDREFHEVGVGKEILFQRPTNFEPAFRLRSAQCNDGPQRICRAKEKPHRGFARMHADMENESSKLLHAELTQKIIGVYYDVFNELGHGFLETVYRNAMRID